MKSVLEDVKMAKYKYVNYGSKIPIHKLSPLVSDESKIRLSVKDEAEDRIKKLDAHTIWGIVLYFSSRNANKEGINVISGIGYYYTLFHCAFAITCLDFNIPENRLHRVSHDQMTRFLKKQVKLGIVSNDLLFLFTDARFVREFANYLSGESGHDKFLSLRHTPRSLITDSYGKIQFIDFVNNLDRECGILIDEFLKLLKNIEDKFSRNIFPVLSRSSDFDYYGEDFLENFFGPDCEVVLEIEDYLREIEDM